MQVGPPPQVELGALVEDLRKPLAHVAEQRGAHVRRRDRRLREGRRAQLRVDRFRRAGQAAKEARGEPGERQQDGRSEHHGDARALGHDRVVVVAVLSLDPTLARRVVESSVPLPPSARAARSR